MIRIFVRLYMKKEYIPWGEFLVGLRITVFSKLFFFGEV